MEPTININYGYKRTPSNLAKLGNSTEPRANDGRFKHKIKVTGLRNVSYELFLAYLRSKVVSQKRRDRLEFLYRNAWVTTLKDIVMKGEETRLFIKSSEHYIEYRNNCRRSTPT